jgi:ABC-type transport system involved in multi-copper enzyme maturation permease subunit
MMAVALYRVELLKMVKRLATWVTFCSYLVPIIFLYGMLFYDARTYESSYFGFPTALPTILMLGAPVTSVFAVALLVLLVSSEFDWRTSRQNIIDGLSRAQWFSAKLLLLPTVALFFYGFQVAFSSGLAWLGTDPTRADAYDVSFYHALAFGGAFLGVMLYGSIALVIAVTIRSAGPALGIALMYQVFEAIVTRTLRGFDLDVFANWFPFQVHFALFDFENYLPTSLRTRTPELEWATMSLLAAAVGWFLVLVAAAYAVYRRRDL